ncbi:MAG: hypothetical protein WKF75_20855 [Singulisphaera sp.]
MMFLSGCFIFTMYRSLRTGPTNRLLPGGGLGRRVHGPGLAVPHAADRPLCHPGRGRYRFIWCYALLAILVWEYRSHPRGGKHRRPLVLGSAAWLLGSLWSCESATYCTAIWLPAYAAMLWRRPGLRSEGRWGADYGWW